MSPPPDPWSRLARLTPARIALGRTGASLPTREVLAFALAHAQARDAVTTPFDSARTAHDIEALGFRTLEATSQAVDRATYLRRPDLGRRLSETSRQRLAQAAKAPCDLAVVVADGLSSTAVHAHAAALLGALQPVIDAANWRVGPIVVASQARVALGDEVGEILQARLVILLVGERPGLSSPDSLGAYITFAPRVGRTDAERNCVSNIRGAGLSYAAAAFKIGWLAREALRLELTGVALKDESDVETLGAPTAPPLPGAAARNSS
ncbi:ethanolamine ammonia-lyase subunit EutC [Phenylobacterium sp.]|uniref:ethanolamine ammonia-lyase subunit EutC n=1 Tax=Phenylobacterium sp. TaxID=1871053 RepID=UPI0025F06F54|nr:ethanolamine ammonia-lyase subunit EutC [Phenylobacterium sp.]